MIEKRIVPFISNEALVGAVEKVITRARKALASSKIEKNLDKNVLDAFSALFELNLLGISYEKWLTMEATRQVQKTMQNAIGDFHQDIIGGIDGWENFEKGHLVYVRNKQRKIIAEIKNKYSTVTGIHLIKIYDELKDALSVREHEGFTAYRVVMITKNKNHFRAFTPPDRTTKKSRPSHEKIIEISGYKFYEMITGDCDALLLIFKAVSTILDKKFGLKVICNENDLLGIFHRTYQLT